MKSVSAKILVIDNYDSFTYNLVFILKQLQLDVQVFRNDKIDLDLAATFDKILLSPGPGLPKDAGIMPQIIQELGAQKSILGICLGHQAIGQAYGAQLINLSEVYHGLSTPIYLIPESSDSIFEGINNGFQACRYHSWAVSNQNFPKDLLTITAQDEHGCIMALAHKSYDLKGLQFHPESILTPTGSKMIYNWVQN